MKHGFHCFILILTGILLLSLETRAQQITIPGHPDLRLHYPARNDQPGAHRPSSCANDSLVFTRQSQIDSFPISHPGCTVLRYLTINGIDASPAITNLDSLHNITDVTEWLTVTQTSITDLTALNGLITAGIIQITENPLMTEFGMTSLEHASLFFFNDLPALTSIADLTNNFTTGFGGSLYIGNTGLHDLHGLEGLTYVGNMIITGNHQLFSLQGLENITSSEFGISLTFNDSLLLLGALSQITSIPTGTFECSYNNTLNGFNGLGNLTFIGGGFWIVGNNGLETLADLNPGLVIENNPAYGAYDSILIEYNPILEACSFPAICNFLVSNGHARINNNAPGCSTYAEVQAACPTCTGVSKIWNGNTSIYWNDSTNWTPMGEPGLCDSVTIPSGLTNYPQLTGNVTIRGLTMEHGSTLDAQFASFLNINGDFSMDSASLYFVNEFHVNNPANVQIYRSFISYGNGIHINNYSGPLLIKDSYIEGVVQISDDTSRVAPSTLNRTAFNGNVIITVNSKDTSAVMTISETGDDDISGNLTFNINAPSHVTAGYAGVSSTTLHLKGDLIVNSSFEGCPSIRSIDFRDPSVPRHIIQTGTAPVHLYNAEISGIMIMPDSNVHVDHTFHFRNGRARTAADRLLVFENNASWFITNLGSYTWGPVKKVGNQAFYFPTGDSIYQRPFSITQPALPTDAYTAQYFHHDPSQDGYDTSLHASGIQKILSKEYWTLNRNNGNSKVKIIVDYDTAHTGPFTSPYDLRLVRWNGSLWENLGCEGVQVFSNTSGRFTSDSISNFGVFALALAPHRIPVITLNPADSVACAAFVSPSVYHFTLDTLMLGNNTFRLQISDSSGSFATPFQMGEINTNHSDSLAGFIPSDYPYGEHYKIRLIGNAPPDTSAAQTLKVVPFPSSSLTVHGPALGCIGGGVYKYYVTPFQQGVIYNWSITPGAGTFTTNNDTAYVTWTTPGNQFLAVRNANRCLPFVGFANISVNVSPPPPAATPVLTNTGRWLFSTIPAANQNSLGYHWYRNDTLISGANNSSYYAAAAGVYRVNYYNLCGESPASNTITFAAASLPQTITFPSIPNKTYGDPDFIIPATASSGLPVSFSISSGPGTIPGNSYHITTTGTVTIRATQPGDNTYDTAAPVSSSFTIAKAAQTISFPVISDKDFAAAHQFTLTAVSSSGLPVAYSVISGPATVSGSNVTLTGLGNVTIRAIQTGDTNYLAAPAVDRSFCVYVSALNTVSGPVSICPGVNATYSVNTISGATYTWRIAGGGTLSSTTSSVTHVWPSPGTYTLIVSAAGSCGDSSSNDSLAVTAITSVQPDSVNNMLPANGAIDQQLPLTLSWIPANPNLYYTYDLYLWRSDTAQPATPYVSNLTGINYTIPLNSGLPYGQTYKWMIAAHNGSCTVTTGGPVQTFSLIPLPDLEVFNVNAPATVLSGQPLSVTWKVKNNGPGNTQTGQHWTDAVYISVDSVLRFTVPAVPFPSNPSLVATKPNVSALNAGQFYNDTATFTVPVTYSGPLYMHLVTNFSPPANNPVIEMTRINDTSHALPVTAVILSPQPDLRVDTVTNPNNTFSGSTINITFSVKNYDVNATGNWVDKIYISKDAVFNINTATLLKYPTGYGYYPATDLVYQHSNGLQHDSSYTVNVQAVIPNFIFGGYYVYVVTNATNTLYEGPNNTNNVNHGPLMQVFLTATPKLVPQSITVSPAISITQSTPVVWTDQNQGAYDNLQASKGHYYVLFNHTCAPYQPSYRDSLGFGSSYWIDRVYISTDSSGLNVNAATLLTEYPHGSLNGFSALGPLPNFVCSGFRPADQNTATAVLPNTNYSGLYSFTVPPNLPQGDYYVYVYANPTKTVYEYPGTPQISRSNKFTVQWPDLTVPSVTVPASASSGQPLPVSYNILNNGPGAVYNRSRKDYFYISSSNTFNGSAVLLDSVVYPSASVPVNIAQTVQKVVTLPNGVSGTRYIFVRTNGDSTFKETDLYNNTNTTGAAVTISLTPPPDLQVTSIVMQDTVPSVFGFPFKYTVTNTGSGLASGTWRDSIFYSCNSSFGYSNTYLAMVRTHPEYLPASASYTDSFSLVIPLTFLTNNGNCLAGDTAHVYIYVKTNANNGLYEPANNNNTGVTIQKSIANPFVDHIVTNVTSNDSAVTSQFYKIKWTVKNIGYNPNNYTYGNFEWYDNLLISPDSVLNNHAIQLTYKGGRPRLNHNQSFTDSANVLIPNLPTGFYYIFANTNCYDRIYAERNLSNNINLKRNASGQAMKVYVSNLPPADLTDSVLSAPATAAVGQPVKVVYRIKNTGAAVTSANGWIDDFWLSANFQPSGLYLGYKNHTGALNSGQSYTDSLTFNIPINQVPANYTIVIRTNYNNSVVESSYRNNLAFRVISVYTPAPTDLVVNAITANDTLILGKSVPVSWSLGNTSNNPATGFETDGIYLGSDSLDYSGTDVLIGTKQNQLNIQPLATANQIALPVVSSVTEGSYFLKVRTDIQNNILETNKLNNAGVRNNRVYVKVADLPVNVTVADTLRPAYLYYKLIVPAALQGKTIQVRLTSNDSLTASNQLYIGLGYIPSAAHFDYTYNAANYGNQQIIIESAEDSVYYIAAKGTKPNAAFQLVTLKAVELPFAISSVSANRGGNTGNVTVLVSGSLFSNNMVARLKGVTLNNIINASAIYFVNSTTLYATFNLSGKPLGLYDVVLKKPDSSVATLPSGFTIELTNNGGLITGSGPNTGQVGSGNAPGCDPGASSGLNSQLQTEIIIPPHVFDSWPFVIQINYVNTTNLDIPAQVKILYSLNNAPLAFSEAGLGEHKTNLYIEFKDSNGPGNIIRAGGTGTVRVYSKAPPGSAAHSLLNYTFQ